MHPKLTARKELVLVTHTHYFSWLGLALALFISGCSSTPNSTPVEERRVVLEEDFAAPSSTDADDELTSAPLEDTRYKIEQAQRYENLAANRSDQEAADAILSAAEFYIQADDSEQAEQAVLALDPSTLGPTQRKRYQIIRAYAAYARGENRAALARVESVLNDGDASFEHRQQQVDALLLTSLIQQRLGDIEPALDALLQRESLLTGEARAETSRYIWQVIDTISMAEREAIMATADNLRLRNRLEQSMTGQVGNLQQAPNQFEQWRGEEVESALQMVGGVAMNFVFVRLAGGFGEAVQTAFAIGLRLSLIVPMVCFPLASACATLVGQNLGASNIPRAWCAVGVGLAVHASITWTVAAIIFVFREAIVRSFSDDPEVIRVGREYLAYASGMFFFWGFQFVFMRSLQGAGDFVVPMLLSLSTSLGLAIPLGFTLSQGELGATGIWTAQLVTAGVGTLLTGAWLCTGRWTRRGASSPFS